MRNLRVAFALLVLAAGVACSGTQTVYVAPSMQPTSTPTTAAGSSTVSFIVVVPAPSSNARHRPNFVAPSNALSASFTLDSVNGTSYTGTPTVANLTSANSNCTVVNGQTSCVVNVTAPPGTLIFTIATYTAANGGGTLIAEGNVSVTTQNGQTVSAPATLSGTVAKVVLAVGSAVAGVSAGVPITVEAQDANGNTILGTYSSPLTLVDIDSSGQTSITTSGSDNPTNREVLSSSDTATLTYAGGAMTAAAVIGASASGLSTANVTTATFLPVQNYLNVTGSVTMFGMSQLSSGGYDTSPPSPTPGPTSTTFPVAIATGQSFNSVNNLVAVTGLQEPNSAGQAGLSSSATSYYSWSAQNNSAVLGFAGFSDPVNPLTEDLFWYPGSIQETCATPYAQLLVVPLPSSWNVYSGSGTCVYAYADAEGDTATTAYNADGSYTESFLQTYSGGGLPPGSQSSSVASNGAATYSLSVIGCCYAFVGTMSIPAPSRDSSTVPVAYSGGGAYPFYNTPAPSSAPNPWLAIGVPHGVPPSPLQSDVMTSNGAITSLPSSCAVPAGLVPASNPPLSEATETITVADPLSSYYPLYSTENIKHYYLNGVGEICNENQLTQYYLDGGDFGDISFWTYNIGNGSVISWYLGVDVNYDSSYSDTFTYITQTTLTSTAARVRNLTEVLPAASQALSAAAYVMARTALSKRHLLKPKKPRSFRIR
jgi:hypothetical protein